MCSPNAGLNSAHTLIAIALGSNQGDRHAHLDLGLRRLAEAFGPLVRSTIVETAPEGVPGPQPPFLNMAVLGHTSLSAAATLQQLLAIEHEARRERPYPLAPRTLDLDLVLFGDDVLDTPALVLPHPRFRERRFVLGPLVEIAADWRDPVTGLTIRQLLDQLDRR